MKLKKLMALCLAATLSFSVVTPMAQATETGTTTTTGTTNVETIKLKNATTFNLKEGEGYAVTLPAYTESIVLPIDIPDAGNFYMPIVMPDDDNAIRIQLYSDAERKEKVGEQVSFYYSYVEEYTYMAEIKAAGTYYLEVSTNKGGIDENQSFKIYPTYYNSAERKIKSGKAEYAGVLSGTPTYLKIVLNKPGYITIEETNEDYSATIDVCDKNKKALTEESRRLRDVPGGKMFMALKKGTYYIKVHGGDRVCLKYTFKAVTEKSGSSQSKAVEIKKGKTVKGLVLHSDSLSKYDWYKVKLTKKQTLSLTMSVKCNSSIDFKIIPANGKELKNSSFSLNGDRTKKYKSDVKLSAGTYYIRVRKIYNTGYYTIKFNK